MQKEIWENLEIFFDRNLNFVKEFKLRGVPTTILINKKGEVLESTNWDEAVCISTEVSINNETTFYSIFGDYIGRLSVFIAAILLIVAFVKGRLKK